MVSNEVLDDCAGGAGERANAPAATLACNGFMRANRPLPGFLGGRMLAAISRFFFFTCVVFTGR